MKADTECVAYLAVFAVPYGKPEKLLCNINQFLKNSRFSNSTKCFTWNEEFLSTNIQFTSNDINTKGGRRYLIDLLTLFGKRLAQYSAGERKKLAAASRGWLETVINELEAHTQDELKRINWKLGVKCEAPSCSAWDLNWYVFTSHPTHQTEQWKREAKRLELAGRKGRSEFKHHDRAQDWV